MGKSAMTTYDFAVIGGGMAGASVAYELSKTGSVALIERESQCGYHSSSRSAAMFIEGYGSPVWRTLNSVSRIFMDNPPDGFAEHPLLSPRAQLEIGREEDTDAVREEYERIAATGVAVEWTDGARIAELCPALNPEGWTCGYYEESASDIDVEAMLQGYLRLLRANGGHVFMGHAVDGLTRSDHWTVTAGTTTVDAAMVVNAAGAWGDEIARMAGLSARGLQPKRRTAIAFAAPEQFPNSDTWCMVGDWGENFYFRPLSAGQLMASPADETDTPPCDAQPEELDIAIIADQIERNTSLKIPRIDRSWAGLRTFAPDRDPVVGPDPCDPTFLWLAGQGGTGIVGSPAAAQLTAALATGGDLPDHLASIDIAAMTPSRLEPIP